MGEGVSLQVEIDRHPLRRQVLVAEQIQRGLQRRAETRDRTAVPVLAVAAGRAAARRLRDAQGDHPGDGVVSIRGRRPADATRAITKSRNSDFQRTRRRSADAHRRRFGAPRR